MFELDGASFLLETTLAPENEFVVGVKIDADVAAISFTTSIAVQLVRKREREL